MSGRRRFGSVVSRTSRDGKRRYVEARYQPPVWAYAKMARFAEALFETIRRRLHRNGGGLAR